MSKTFVLDCSMSIAWCFEDEQTDYTKSVLKTFENNTRAIVPLLWKLEVVNVLMVSYKRKRLSEEGQLICLKYFDELRIDPIYLDDDQRNLLSLCKKYNLTSYDASYLDLAIKFNAPIATLDSALQKAAIDAGVGAYLL
jgi:predicted nucleic acid-binding protein